MSSNVKAKNPNRGYLAPNQKSHDRQPDWRGKASVNGVDLLMSGWFKDVKNEKGETARIISFEFTDPKDLPQRAPAAQQAAPASQNQGGQAPSAPPAQGGGAFEDIFSDTRNF